MIVFTAQFAQTIDTSILLMALLVVGASYQAYKKEMVQLRHETMMDEFLSSKD